jgi:hypothetical protein
MITNEIIILDVDEEIKEFMQQPIIRNYDFEFTRAQLIGIMSCLWYTEDAVARLSQFAEQAGVREGGKWLSIYSHVFSLGMTIFNQLKKLELYTLEGYLRYGHHTPKDRGWDHSLILIREDPF